MVMHQVTTHAPLGDDNQEFAGRRMGREEKPAIRDRLEQVKEQAERKPEHRTLDREKVKTRDRSVQR